MTNGNDLINETRYKVDELVSESYPNHAQPFKSIKYVCKKKSISC